MINIEQHYIKHKKQLISSATNRMYNKRPEIAEEAVQEAYANIIAQNIEPNNFEHYLQTILTNVIHKVNHAERMGGMCEDITAVMSDEGSKVFKDVIVEQIKADLASEEKIKEAVDMLNKALTGANKGVKDVVSLYFFQGLKSKDIATIVGKSPSVVSKMISRFVKNI